MTRAMSQGHSGVMQSSTGVEAGFALASILSVLMLSHLTSLTVVVVINYNRT